eukprot:3451331-Ditylum_brightwellii.AAC.1
MELQRGKADICRPDNGNLGATAAVSLCLTRITQYCEQDTEGEYNASLDIFEGDSWFASVTTSQKIHEIRGYFRGIVKTAHSLCSKEKIEKIMEPFPGEMHM